jgi:hypothetical protein
MEDTLQFIIFPVLGALFGAGFVFLARWSGLKVRQILAYGLIAACFVYVALSGRSDNPAVWLGFEMTGVAIFGSAALLSMIGSLWWLAAGFALHPVWVIVFHYVGAGSAFVPKEYSLANAAFDLTLAAYLIYEILRGPRSAIAASVLEQGSPVKSGKRRQK